MKKCIVGICVAVILGLSYLENVGFISKDVYAEGITLEEVEPLVVKQYTVTKKAVAKDYYVGDADFNGKVDLQDAQTVLKIALKIKTPTQREVFAVIGCSYDYSEENTPAVYYSENITLENAKQTLKRALNIEEQAVVTRSTKNVYYEALYEEELDTWDFDMTCCVLNSKERAQWFVEKLGDQSMMDAVNRLDEEAFNGQSLLFEMTECSFDDIYTVTAESVFIDTYYAFDEATYNESFTITSFNEAHTLTYAKDSTYLYQFSFIDTGKQNLPPTGKCYSNFDYSMECDYRVASLDCYEAVDEDKVTFVSDEADLEKYRDDAPKEMKEILEYWDVDFDKYTYIFYEKNHIDIDGEWLDIEVSGASVNIAINDLDYIYPEDDKDDFSEDYEDSQGQVYCLRIRKDAIEGKEIHISDVRKEEIYVEWNEDDTVNTENYYIDDIVYHDMGDIAAESYVPEKVGENEYRIPIHYSELYGKTRIELYRMAGHREALDAPPEISINCEGVSIENYGLTVDDWAGIDVSDVEQTPDFFKTQCSKGDENPLFYVKSWKETRVGAVQFQFPAGMEPDFFEVEDRVLSEDGSIRYEGKKEEITYRCRSIDRWFSTVEFNLAEHYSIGLYEPYMEYKPMKQLVHPYYRGYNVKCYWVTDGGLQSCTYYIVLRTQTTMFENN